MKKVVLFLHTGFCGMDAYEFWEVPEDLPDEHLSEFAWERAVDHAESYGIYPLPDYEIDDEDADCYSENIEGSWELYDPHNHDCYRIGGDTSWIQY